MRISDWSSDVCSSDLSPGIDAVRLLAGGAEALLGVELRLHRGHDVLGDVVLDGEDVLQLAVVLLGPEVLAGLGVDDLNGDAQALTRRPHAAFQDVAHAEIAGDLPDVCSLALVYDARTARDHEDTATAREKR